MTLPTTSRRSKGWRRPLGWLQRAGQFFFALSFSSLTRRIVSLNLAGLVALVASILYLSQFRAGLIDARAQSLLVQAEIIAGAIAASATVETNTITIDPDRLLDLKPGESYGVPDESSGLDFPINPERVAPVLRRLISPTKTRARIYGGDGGMILDSRNLYGRGDVLRFELPPPTLEKPGILERATIATRTWLNRGDLPLYRELGPENGKGYHEVVQALDGIKTSMVRVNDRGEVIVSVAVPVQRFPRRAWRPDAVDARRRHRPDGDRRAAGDFESRRRRLCGHDRAVHCCWRARSPAPYGASPTAPSASAAASRPASRFPISPAAATRSAISPARCAT